MGRTLDDVGAAGGGLYINLEAKQEIHAAGAAFWIVNADPFIPAEGEYGPKTQFHVQFEPGVRFDFMPEDANDDSTFILSFPHTDNRKRKADMVLRALSSDPDPIGPTYLETGKSSTKGYADWWDITATAPEKPTARAATRGRSAPPARRAAPAPDDDDGI